MNCLKDGSVEGRREGRVGLVVAMVEMCSRMGLLFVGEDSKTCFRSGSVEAGYSGGKSMVGY